jgi:hypothetical protein
MSLGTAPRWFVGIGALALFSAAHLPIAQAQGPAPAPQGAPQGQQAPGGGRGIQGGGGQGIVGGVTPPAQGRGGGRGGRAAGPPPGPAPRNAQGRTLLGSADVKTKGVWVPRGFGITAPLASRDIYGKTLEKLPFQPWARALWEDREKHELEPHARCKASGVARQFLTPYGVEFVELTDAQRIFIFDIGGPHTYRTIYMDGRKLPAKVTPTYYGYNVGRWEGDTLVVESTGFNESFWMDRRGLPHTEKLKTTEKFTRIDSNTLRYEVTIDDPGAYTEPWSATFNLGWEGDTELFEYVCQQANFADELMVGNLESVDRTTTIIP